MSLMVAFFLIATTAGMLLALHFKVVVLLPATLLAAVAVLASGHQPKITMTLTLLGTAAFASDRIFRWLVRSRAPAQSDDGALRRFFFNANRALWLLRGGRHVERTNKD
jgi:hypothetical protein